MDRRPLVAAVAIILSLPILVAACGAGVGPSAPGASPTGSPAASIAPGQTASASPTGLSQPQLALRLIETFGTLWYCDPDMYPVAREDEATVAVRRFGEVRADPVTWAAIAAAIGAAPDAASYPPDVQLAAYRRWKELAAIDLQRVGDGSAFDLLFAPAGSGGATGERIVGTIAADGTISIQRREPAGPPNCPICLARGTRIAAPGGWVAVETLRAGDMVWTLDAGGQRLRATVLEVASVPVPTTHRLVRVVLSDGRTVEASPGHPLPDGRVLGSLVPGDRVDGSTVASTALIPYAGGRTFDLRVSGPTGLYLAGDGIPLASTLDR